MNTSTIHLLHHIQKIGSYHIDDALDQVENNPQKAKNHKIKTSVLALFTRNKA